MLKVNNRPLSYPDMLAVPLMAILSFLLQLWVSAPLAVASSVFLVFSTYSLFEQRPASYKRMILFILLATLASYIAAALVMKLTGRHYLT